MSVELPPVARAILAHDRGRDPARLRLKYAKMRASPFAFLRATPFLYFAHSPLPPPLVSASHGWLCGDLHLENFGAYRGDNRLVYFDVNDFDEAALGPVGLDLGRMVTSMLVAARESGWPAGAWSDAVDSFVATYAETLATGKPRWIERRTARGPVRRLLRQLARRRQRTLLKARTTGTGTKRRLLKDGLHALPATAPERTRISALFRTIAGRDPAFAGYRALDVARRIAGTSSLGAERYVILVDRDGGPDGARLLDLKTEARPASIVAGAQTGPFRSNAERTVTIQTLVQAIPPSGLSVQRLGRARYVMRDLQPSDDRMNIERLTDAAELRAFAADLGRLTAWMHLRGAGRFGAAGIEELMAFGRRRDWRKPLLVHARAARSATLAQHAEFAALDPELLLAGS
jgi:uncharacterized protein (DUF2252 family)